MLVNDKYKIRLNTTFQPSIKILNKCSCVSEDTKWVPSLLRFVAISSSYSLKRVFLRKSRDALLCFSEPRFGFSTLVRTHATTFVTFILAFENIQNSFSCGSPLVHAGLQNTSFLGKSYRFGKPIVLFSKADTLRLLKIRIMFCSPRRAKKRYQLLDYQRFHLWLLFSI